MADITLSEAACSKLNINLRAIGLFLQSLCEEGHLEQNILYLYCVSKPTRATFNWSNISINGGTEVAVIYTWLNYKWTLPYLIHCFPRVVSNIRCTVFTIAALSFWHVDKRKAAQTNNNDHWLLKITLSYFPPHPDLYDTGHFKSSSINFRLKT